MLELGSGNMIFVDSNFIIALSLKKHNKHDRAVKIWEKIQNEDKITSKLVVTEVLNILNVRLKQNIELTEKVYNFIAHNIKVLYDNEYHDKAFQYLKLYYPDERLPFNDCVYMVLMEELEIEKIASFDRHFDLNDKIIRVH